jgi:hypothetical protein
MVARHMPQNLIPPGAPDPSRMRGAGGPTVGEVFRHFMQNPGKHLLARWNWKSAVLSSLFQSAIFFLTNLTGGLHAAFSAMTTELLFRGATSGFYGAVTEAFCDAEPAWAAALTAMLLLPLANVASEFLVHWLRGTPHIAASIAASMVFTALSTLFNLYAMRRDVLVVCSGRASLRQDLMRMPQLLFDFAILAPFRALHICSRMVAAKITEHL